MHDYFHAGETVRTITVTYSPGAENEVTRQCTIPRHTAFSVYKGGEAVASFTDPACTQPFAGSDGVSDMHLYVK